MSKGISKIQLALSVVKGRREEAKLLFELTRVGKSGNILIRDRIKELDREVAAISGQVIMVSERDDTRLLS